MSNIEEINKLIEEIEKDHRKVDQENKIRYRENKKRKRQDEKRRRKKLKKIVKVCQYTYIYFFILLWTQLSKDRPFRIQNEDNLFENRKVIATAEEVEDTLKELEEELNITIDPGEIENYLLLNAIRENKHLTQENKEALYLIGDVLAENSYLNKEEAYTNLLNVKIKYENKKRKDNVAGSYNGFSNKAKIYNEEQTDVATHEGIHCAIYNEEVPFIPRFIKEGMTELLNKEYCCDDPFYIDRYPYEISMLKMLMEIIEPDYMLEAYTTGNLENVYEQLAIYGNSSKKEAKKTIEVVSEALDELDETNKAIDYTRERKTALNYLDNCILNKKSQELDFQDANYYCNKAGFLSMFPTNEVIDSIISSMDYENYYNKAYFCDMLQETGKNKMMLKNRP